MGQHLQSQDVSASARPIDGSLTLDIGRVCAAVTWLFALLLAANIVQDVALTYGVTHDRIWVLDVNVEASFYTWASSVLIAFNAALLTFLGFADRRRRRAWFALAVCFFIGSAEEIVQLHEHLSGMLSHAHVLSADGVFHFPWVAPAMAFVVLFALAFMPFLLSLPRLTAILFVVGGSVYVGGAVGFEMLAGLLFHGVEDVMSPAYRMSSDASEGLEVLGQLIFLWALLRRIKVVSSTWRVTLA